MTKSEHRMRKEGIDAKSGMILYHAGGDDWKLHYPDDYRTYGGAAMIRAMNFIYYLSKGKNQDDARFLAGLA